MEIIIKGEVKEIAALLLELEVRRRFAFVGETEYCSLDKQMILSKKPLRHGFFKPVTRLLWKMTLTIRRDSCDEQTVIFVNVV